MKCYECFVVINVKEIYNLDYEKSNLDFDVEYLLLNWN